MRFVEVDIPDIDLGDVIRAQTSVRSAAGEEYELKGENPCQKKG